VDANHNRIDDAIDAVNTSGWPAAFENGDPTRRMLIGVQNTTPITFAVYVGYEHKPTLVDQTALSATGVAMVWPFQYIDYIETRASYSRIQTIAALPGVTHVEAIPVMYATNHYGARVVRSRDSRGLAKAENYVLFPSVRQELGFDGTGVVIAILDTGVNDAVDGVNPGYPGHESLQNKFLGGGEFWSGQAALNTPLDGSTNPQDHGAEASSYHATHVAGSAMGTGGNGGFFAGVAPGARLVDCKVLSDAGASVGGAARGLEWCIANKNRLWAGLAPGSIWQGIDVINMSLGSPMSNSNGNDATCLLVNQATDAGICVCVASGNDSQAPGIATPAAADKSICVGASQHNRTLRRDDDQVTSFSNEGPRLDDGDADHRDEMKPNVVAPGAGIISADGDFTSNGTDYQQLSGTSMAAPHLAGCCALLLQANPALTPQQARTILENTAEHNVPTIKASGDRGQDPFGIDVNYDPSCGWGLVDMYAACKEALNSTTGVQVTQIRAVARPASAAVDVTWITQREYPFLGFNLKRAPDAGGAPGTFSQINTLLIPPSASGDAVIQGDDNRTPYLFVDGGPGLVLGNTYWYRVEWIDALGTHLEPPVPVDFGIVPRVATLYYSIAHNAVDNDLFIRVGTDHMYDPGTHVGDADFERLGPAESGQDSMRVLLPTPPNTGTSTLGTVEHFWSVGLTTGDNVGAYLPPSIAHPWFLYVLDGGFVNRTGRVTSFSMFVNDSPGSAGGVTYVTDHQPMPQPSGEFGVVPAILWIPEQPPVAVAARFQVEGVEGGVRLRLHLTTPRHGTSARVFRSLSDDFDTRQLLTPEAIRFEGADFEYLDASVAPGVTYYYWIEYRDAQDRPVVNGPVAASSLTLERTTALFARGNPGANGTVLAYVVGRDAAAAGAVEVSIRVHDVHGRLVRDLKRGQESAGSHVVRWDATDDLGRRVSAGVYYVRMRVGAVTRHVKLTIVR
jgi:subtilisin family serine protease